MPRCWRTAAGASVLRVRPVFASPLAWGSDTTGEATVWMFQEALGCLRGRRDSGRIPKRFPSAGTSATASVFWTARGWGAAMTILSVASLIEALSRHSLLGPAQLDEAAALGQRVADAQTLAEEL